MRKLVTLFLILFSLNTFSSNWTGINSSQSAPPKIITTKSSDYGTTILYEVLGFKKKDVQTQKGIASIIELDKATPILKTGAPDLCKISSSIIIPSGAIMKVNIDESEYTDYPNIEIAPSKGNLFRNIDPQSVAYTYGSEYSRDEFFPGKLAELRSPYTFRDFNGQTAVIYPFQYNPVQKILRVYTKIKVTISALPTNKVIVTNPSKIDKEYAEIYKRHFLNYTTTRYTPVNEDGKMLIISYGQFIPAMQAFVNWKKQIGTPTEIVDVSTIGDNVAIKNYVANYYNTKGLKYLLLVGDAEQVPSSSTTSGDSDNNYGYILGDDHYQEIFVGRFSAENIAQVQTQIERIIAYERNPVNTKWMSRGITIGSTEGGNGSGDDGEIDWQHQRNMRTDLLAFTYSSVKELYDGTQAGGTDDAGDPNATSVANAVNNGSGIILYTGHGSDNSFVTTGFSNSNMSLLTNTGNLPFIYSVACVNGNFVGQTCFAEGWMRATYNNQPAGAIGTLMSTINQSWDPPMCAQDEMVDILTELQPNNIRRTFAGIAINGCALMNDEYGTGGADMTDTWTIFGDPSLMVRTDSAKIMTVSHQSTTPVGTTQLTFNCNVEGAKIALTMNNEILGTGIVSGGSATISFATISIIDTIHVTATAFNYLPYIGNILTITPTGPYIVLNNKTISDISGNNNQQADYSENITINTTLQNVGVNDAQNVNATINTSDSYLSITDNAQNFGNINISSSNIQNDAYAINIANDVPDQHVANINMDITDGASNSWTASFNFKINAPSLAIGTLNIDDASGNNNNKLDIDETSNLIIASLNNGHSNALNTTGVLTTTSSYITITNGTANLTTLNAQGTKNATFELVVAPNTPTNTNIEFTYTLSSGAYTVAKTFSLTVGIIVEDFETGNFAKFNWQQSGNNPWSIQNTGMFEGQNCSKSGIIGNNQTSVMQLTANVITPDTISFFKKTSCEDSQSSEKWDYLEFFIDDVSKGWWDGIEDWSRVAFNVAEGQHTFKWVYAKDNYSIDGSDAAWVDYIIFPPLNLVGLEKQEAQNTFSIYPNPVNDNMIVSIGIQEISNVEISIINTIGQIVYVDNSIRSAGLNSINLSLPQLTEGVYFCKVNANNKVYTKKIIVK